MLQFLEGDLSICNGIIELKKLTKTEGAEKLTIEVGIESVGNECDCLKFKLKEGDTFDFLDTLKVFDDKMLE